MAETGKKLINANYFFPFDYLARRPAANTLPPAHGGGGSINQFSL
jgi:hypothetical protein